MKFMAIADSDIGIVKDTNQDSLCLLYTSGESLPGALQGCD